MKVTINIEKRYAFTIISLIIVAVALVGVIAYNSPGNPAVFGHSLNEVNFTGNLEIENAVAGDVATGRLSTQGLGAICPNNWGCGVHTWDVYADASIRAKNLVITSGAETSYPGDDLFGVNVPGKICLGTSDFNDASKCITDWSEISGGQVWTTNCREVNMPGESSWASCAQDEFVNAVNCYEIGSDGTCDKLKVRCCKFA